MIGLQRFPSAEDSQLIDNQKDQLTLTEKVHLMAAGFFPPSAVEAFECLLAKANDVVVPLCWSMIFAVWTSRNIEVKHQI